ncbi:MAG: STAS domain-containing protein [Halothiobacillaceae bacterium]|nr:STAS domain-containing protein [Halothiobacillaceae bacterium]
MKPRSDEPRLNSETNQVISTQRWHVENQDHTLVIAGDITLATINPVLARVASLTQAKPVENVDLSGLGLCDSSAVALVLALRRQQRGVNVLHAPAAFSAIVQACQLGALFPDLAQNRTGL